MQKFNDQPVLEGFLKINAFDFTNEIELQVGDATCSTNLRQKTLVPADTAAV